jgi:hypothetical protein
LLTSRIGADDEEIGRSRKAAVAGARGKKDNVAGVDADLTPTFAAEEQACRPGNEAEDFVRCGMVVVEIVNAVAPLRRPFVATKERFACGGGIVVAKIRDTAVEQHGQALVIRNPAIPGQAEDFRIG